MFWNDNVRRMFINRAYASEIFFGWQWLLQYHRLLLKMSLYFKLDSTIKQCIIFSLAMATVCKIHTWQRLLNVCQYPFPATPSSFQLNIWLLRRHWKDDLTRSPLQIAMLLPVVWPKEVSGSWVCELQECKEDAFSFLGFCSVCWNVTRWLELGSCSWTSR